jgi:hypothetical protein
MRTTIAILSLLTFVTVGYAMDIQEEFDPIGPAVKYFTPVGSDKTLVYIDEGERVCSDTKNSAQAASHFLGKRWFW